MKKKSENSTIRIIICLIYIFFGACSVVSALTALLSFNLIGILTCAGGIIMFIAGFYGLFSNKSSVCRTFGITIFLIAAIGFIVELLKGNFHCVSLVQIVFAWFYIINVK